MRKSACSSCSLNVEVRGRSTRSGFLYLKILLRCVLKQKAIRSLPRGRWVVADAAAAAGARVCDGWPPSQTHTANSLTTTTTTTTPHHYRPQVFLLFLSTYLFLPVTRPTQDVRRNEISPSVMPVSLQNATPTRRTLSQNRTPLSQSNFKRSRRPRELLAASTCAPYRVQCLQSLAPH